MCFRCLDGESDSSLSGGSDTANDDDDDGEEEGKKLGLLFIAFFIATRKNKQI